MRRGGWWEGDGHRHGERRGGGGGGAGAVYGGGGGGRNRQDALVTRVGYHRGRHRRGQYQGRYRVLTWEAYWVCGSSRLASSSLVWVQYIVFVGLLVVGFGGDEFVVDVSKSLARLVL